ncbi:MULTISPECIES: hypothetical protein [Cupriavidus]|nr:MULTISPECIES: hypothetical protein [Cupriavidus]
MSRSRTLLSPRYPTLRSLGAGLAQLAPLAVAMAGAGLPFWLQTLGH